MDRNELFQRLATLVATNSNPTISLGDRTNNIAEVVDELFEDQRVSDRAAYNSGHRDGYASGYDYAKDKFANPEVLAAEFREGFRQGKDLGYETGLNEGREAAKTETPAGA